MSRESPPAWFADVRKAPDEVPPGATRPAPLLFDAQHRPITSRDGWEHRRAELERAWLTFLGRVARPRIPAPIRVIDEERVGGIRRQHIAYQPEPGLEAEAYLLVPEAQATQRPGAVVLHSTVDYTIRQPAGLEGPEGVWIGWHLASRGYVVICPRCFLWEHGKPGKLTDAVAWLRGRHPEVKGMAKMLADAMAAVDVLVGREDVDPGRIGAIGHSLGAKEVLYLAAFDPRIRASVSSEGGIGLSYSNWDAPWYLGEAIRRPGFGLDHGQVLAMVAPRAFLLVGGDSADGAASWPYIEAALPVWSTAGAPDAIGLLNHRGGHAFPEVARERSYQWLDWFLHHPAPA